MVPKIIFKAGNISQCCKSVYKQEATQQTRTVLKAIRTTAECNFHTVHSATNKRIQNTE